MAEQQLHHTQVSAVVEQMGGESVAQGVGRQRYVDTGLARIGLDAHPEHLPRHAGGFAGALPAARGDEQKGAVAPLQQLMARSAQVVLQPVLRGAAERHESLFAAFARNLHHALIERHAHHWQRHQFTHPQATGVEQFEHGAVAQAQRRVHLGCGEQRFHLRFAQGLGAARRLTRGVELQRGVVGAQVLTQGPAVKAAQHHQPPVGRGGFALHETGGDIRLHIAQRRLDQGLALRKGQPARHQREVAAVSGEGVGREAVFQPEGVAETVDRGGAGFGRGRPFEVKRGFRHGDEPIASWLHAAAASV